MSWRGAPAPWLLLLGLSALGTFALGADDHRRSYLDGVRAFERQDWETAARLLSQAIAGRGEESPRARLVGAIPEPYLPHAYLGLALFRLRLCQAARPELAESLRQKAVEAVPAVAREVKAAEAHCAHLEEARRASEEAEAVAERQSQERASPREEPAERRAVDGTEPAASEEGVEQTMEATGLAPEATDAAAKPEAPTAETPSATVVSSSGSVAKTSLPAPLLLAMEAYFGGDYGRAVQLLESLPTAPESAAAPQRAARERLLTAFFRAAARYALYLLSGEEEQSLLLAAQADLETARRENPAFAPHPDFFSPRFLELFRDHP